MDLILFYFHHIQLSTHLYIRNLNLCISIKLLSLYEGVVIVNLFINIIHGTFEFYKYLKFLIFYYMTILQ